MNNENSPAAVWPTAARAEPPANSSARRTSKRRRPEPGRRRPTGGTCRIDFGRINRAALVCLPDILARWLPDGRVEGTEYVALNPRRADHRLGSFKVNLDTGRWADFAVEGARGRDVISLAAYLRGISQIEAAERLAAMLGVDARDDR